MLFKRKGKFFLNLDGSSAPANADLPQTSQQDSDRVKGQTKETELSVAETAVTETAVTETTVAETAVAEKPVVETAVGKTALGKTAVGKTAVGKTAVPEVSVPSLNSSKPKERDSEPIVAESDNAAATVESMMKDLATSEAQRPTVIYTTFAPDNLLPGSGLRPRNRRPGAALKDFRGIAQDLFRN